MKQGDANELRLLVVEDETVVAMDLEELLDDLGHIVLGVAATVPQAMLLVEKFAGEIDAVVLDANLAGCLASPVAEALGKLKIPYILASGYPSGDLRANGLDAPFVRKPYRSSDIQDALQALA